MARKRSRNSELSLVDNLEGMVDRLTGSVENVGETAMSYIHRVISWAKKHKKLIVLGALAVLAYNYFLKVEDSDEDEDYEDDEN